MRLASLAPSAARSAALAVALLASGCTSPPPEAYVGGRAAATGGQGIGQDASNEACVQQPRGAAGGLDVFCGSWQQPSATAALLGPGGPDRLAATAQSSPWRSGLDTRFACEAPQPTTVLGSPALVLACTRRIGGWPQVALVTSIDGKVYAADGIQPALPVLPRAIGILAGRATADGSAALPRSGVEALLASRLAAQSFSAGDVGQFDALIRSGTRANLADGFVSAEDAYRAALALQRKALGRADPDEASTLALIALQVSNQGRYPEADALFAEAERLAPKAADRTTVPRVAHYGALNQLNQHHDAEALALLQRAEAGYAALLPPEALRPRIRTVSPFALGRSGTATVRNPVPDRDVVVDQSEQSALLGLVETRRYEAIVLRDQGKLDQSEAKIRQAATLALSQDMRQPMLTARLLRTAATDAAARGDSRDAASGLNLSTIAFGQALPGTRPLATTELLQAAQLRDRGDMSGALGACRRANTLLLDLKDGVPPALVGPCLDVYADAASRAGSGAQAILAEMFEAAQQAQGNITSEQIARSTARLRENARDPRVGEAIRRRELAGDKLAELVRQRDALALVARGTYVPPSGRAAKPADLDAAISEARAQLADSDAALQAASPNFGQLVQEVARASDVLGALRPGEAFASIVLGDKSGWVFLLRDGQIAAHRLGASPEAIRALVVRFRSSVTPGERGLPQFDGSAAEGLYAATLGQVGPQLAGATQIVVAPSGALLSVPFGALLTGPAGADLSAAPFLIKQAAIAHVPAPANFVSLRRVAGTSRASRPWFGLGDFRPITLAQAEQTFPGPACRESAQLFAGLPRLPFAARELDAARQLLGGASTDELEGGAYTVANVQRANLKDYRILHFASHALLPAELKCAQEPSVVTSAPAGAGSANGALLTAPLIAGMDLDADAVILSACNSAGPNGPAGESLSGLARSFFYAGARSMLVTHWSVNDQTSAFLVVDTLKRLKEGKDGGLAGSLRGAELALLNGAGHGLPAEVSHPFYWAPFALIGEGGVPLRDAALSARRAPLL